MKRRVRTGDCPAGGGVGGGGLGFAVQQQQRELQLQRSGDGGGSRRRTWRLDHPRVSENGGGCLTCHVRQDSGCLLTLRRSLDMGRPGPEF